MRITYKLISFLIIIQFLYGCTTSKEIYYSYKVGTYSLHIVKNFIYSDDLISYDDYLFEFKIKININNVLHGDSDSTSIYSDTIGVYLLSGANKLYYEFDTFAIKNKVVKIGKFADKQFGFKFNFSGTDSTSNLSFTSPKEVVTNNIHYFITEIVSNNKTADDSINQKLLLIKNEKFNSLYKVHGIKFPDSNYCIVGFHIYDFKNRQSIFQEIESIKPLTEKQKKICASIVKKSKLCIVDTIKGLQ